MSIQYPIRGISPSKLYEINETGKSGWYPIGKTNFWHGGINLYFNDPGSGEEPIRSIANGEIVAYRLTMDYAKLSKTFKEGKNEKQKYCQRDFSNNFVLIRHDTLKTPKGVPIVFYSLYAHLLPFKHYRPRYDKDQVSILTRWKCVVNTREAGIGDYLRDRKGDVVTVIPKGFRVTVDPDAPEYIGKEKSDTTRRLGVIYHDGEKEFKGYIWKPNFKGTDATYQCERGTKSVARDKRGLAVYQSADQKRVIRVLPFGTEIYFENPYEAVTSDGIVRTTIARVKLGMGQAPIGWVTVTPESIRTDGKVVDPVIGDSVQNRAISITAGEIIGWPGNDGTAPGAAFHFEIFTTIKDLFGTSGFWRNPPIDGVVGNALKIKKGAPLSEPNPTSAANVVSFRPTGDKADTDLYIARSDTRRVTLEGGGTWIGIPESFIADDNNVWFDRANYADIEKRLYVEDTISSVEKMNLFNWETFFTKCKEKDISNGEDGFCDAGPIFKLIDADQDGFFDPVELQTAVRTDPVRQNLRQLVVAHPSEWYYPSSEGKRDNKWGTRLKGPKYDPNKPRFVECRDYWESEGITPPRYGFNYPKDKYEAFLEIAAKACFLQDVDGFKEDERLWYFHPISFIQHLKRIFDTVPVKLIYRKDDLRPISDYSHEIMSEIAQKIDIDSFTITSTLRTAEDQARIMYNNLIGTVDGQGVTGQKALYGDNGNEVIKVFEKLDDEGKSAAQIKSGMKNKIDELMSEGKRVSRHVCDWAKWNVFDIAPSEIPVDKHEAFTKALEAHTNIHKVIPYPNDPAFHIEIKQP